jgi:protein SCO1
MTTTRLFVTLSFATAVVVTLARTGPGNLATPDSRVFQVTGIVTAPLVDGRVTVAHDEISGYMPAMTMPFTVGPDVRPTLTAGDRVRFVLRVTEEASRAESFTVIGRAAIAGNAMAPGGTRPASRLKKGDLVPPFTLTTAEDRPFTAGDLAGHVTAVTFIFTRCPVPEFCPLVVKRFQQIQREIERNASLAGVRLLSVTLDPAFDTPQVLSAYASAMKAYPARWQFVTGSAEEIARFASAFAIHVERNGVLIDHTLATAVIGRDGRVVEIWRGNGWKAAEVVETMQRITATSAPTN